MPSKNVIKEYVKDGIYHSYNRGINKQDLFLDKRDYATFLYFLRLYLSPPEKELPMCEGVTLTRQTRGRKNFYGKIELLGYCLMPNHFHLLIKQRDEKDLSEFMRCLMTNYSMYFNHRYERIGPPFQGTYKAVLVRNEDYLLHLSRYIHLNPTSLNGVTLRNLLQYDWSSYAEYLGKRDTEWVRSNLILSCFEQNIDSPLVGNESYLKFVEDYSLESEKLLGNLTLEM